VVVKRAADSRQVQLVRAHLQTIQADFLKGDFTGPSHVHGNEMPGLADLKEAQAGQIAIDYAEVVGGAQLTYRISDPKVVAVLHQWFNAQLSDHGSDAMAGRPHEHGAMSGP
jgi:hypothetical protein